MADNDTVYIVGVQGYDGVSIIAVCADYAFACELADRKHKELKTQVDIFIEDICHEFEEEG